METVLAVIAIVISIATAIAEHARWRRVGGKVIVKAYTAIVGPFEDGMSRSCVCVHAVNVGRGTTVIKSWGLADPQGRFSIGPSGSWSHGPETPTVLSPESPEAFWKLDYQEQKTDLQNAHPGVPHTLQAFVRLPGNKVVRSRNIVSLGQADAVRPTLRERWEKFRSAGIFGMTYRPGHDGQPHKFEVLATGPRTARDLTVDVVRDFGQGQQPLPDGAYTSIKRKRLRKGKTIQVPVPHAAYGHNLYFRVSWKSRGARQEFRAGIPERQVLDSAAAQLRARRGDVEES
jgi:hypothetical protein